MTVAIERKNDGEIVLTISVPWDRVKKTYDHIIEEIVGQTEISGFRKGKAPKNLVEEKLDKTKTYEEVLSHLIPEIYNEAVTQEKLKPFVQPKVELKEATEAKDWVIIVHTTEKPAVTLKDYKKAIRDLKAQKHQKIWVPGKEAQGEQKPEELKPTMDELVGTLLPQVSVPLPAILVESEVNRMLSDIIKQTQQLGLSVEQYLSSTGQTSESLRKKYTTDATGMLTLELALEQIADTEGIFVSDDDIEAVIKTAKSDEEKKTLGAQKYYLASVLRRQKTLDFISSL